MEFTNTFTVDAPIPRVWSLLMSPEEVTACVPGAAITEKVDDTHFKGTIKVKLGAVQVSYRGEMEMTPNETDHTIVLTGKGSETRGSGGATGSMTVSLAQEGSGTSVTVDSKVDVTGKVATFGRGIMQDVANRLTKQFASCLATKLEEAAGEDIPGTAAVSGSVSPTAPETDSTTTPPAPSPIGSQESQTLSSPPAAPQRSSPAGTEPEELKIADILADIARARLAAALRTLATWIEPK
jgi:carbon monoxide dehydrogenase subunit G